MITSPAIPETCPSGEDMVFNPSRRAVGTTERRPARWGPSGVPVRPCRDLVAGRPRGLGLLYTP